MVIIYFGNDGAEMVGNLSHYLLKKINKYLKMKYRKEKEVCHVDN